MLEYQTITFTNTEDGEAVAKAFTDALERTFDCVLMDMCIPKLDGIKATAAIGGLRRPGWPYPPTGDARR